MTDATDTVAERLADYKHLYGTALVGRERIGEGIRFRFRAEPGAEDRFAQQGLEVVIRDEGELRPATPAEHGWTDG